MSSQPKRSSLSNSSLHIATPPAYHAISLFDVEWNNSPPASREHNTIETQWTTGLADAVNRAVPHRYSRGKAHSSIESTNVIRGSPFSISLANFEDRRAHSGSYLKDQKKYHQTQRQKQRPLVNQVTLSKLPQLGVQTCAPERKLETKATTKLFDLTTLSKYGPKSMRKHLIPKNISQQMAGAASKTIPRRYKGFSEKTVLLLTSNTALDFVNKSNALKSRKHRLQNSIMGNYGSNIRRSSSSVLPEQVGPIWGADAHYRQPNLYRNVSGRINGCQKGQDPAYSTKSRQAKRIDTLAQDFNIFMNVSKTNPQAFRQGNTPKGPPRKLVPVEFSGKHLQILRNRITESVRSRSCGLSLREIEEVTSRATEMRQSETQSDSMIAMTLGQKSDTKIASSESMPDLLKEEIYIELRTRQRSRKSSSRLASRKASKQKLNPPV